MDQPTATSAMARLARGLASAVGVSCAVVLLGYALHLGVVVDLDSGLSGMSPLTALALLLLAAGTFLDGGPRRRDAIILASGAVGVGLCALLVIGVFGKDILSGAVASRLFLFSAQRAGTTSAATAVCVMALGAAAIARARPRASDALAAIALVTAIFDLLGYAYDVRDLYAVPVFRAMAPQTALAITALGVASLAIRPQVGWAAIVGSPRAGGVATRRLLAFTLLPPIAGWVLYHATDAHRLGPGAAMAFLVVLTVVPLSLLILRIGEASDALDLERDAKADLRRAGDRELRLIADALPVLIAFIDKSLTYLFANRTYEDWFYRKPDEVIGHNVQELLDAEGFTRRRAHMEAALAGREARFELAWPHRDGRPRDAEIRYMPRVAANGTIDGFYVFVADITDRKQLERELLLKNEALEARATTRTRERDRIWQTTNDLIGSAGFDGYLKSINPAWTKLLGWSETELLAEPFAVLIDPADHAATAAVVQRLAAGETVADFVDHLRVKDGGWRTVMWTAVPETDTAIFYIIGRDLTEQRKIEEQLRQSQKMEAVGQLTGGLAHDFNNLLTGITGSLDLLRTRIAQGRVGEVERYVNAAQGAAARAAALTHRLLAFSRRQTLAPKATDPNRLVADMEELIRRTMGPSIVVEFVAAGGLWTTLVDPSQLENALLNLCINARDAMPDGGKLTIETANRWLDARAARDRSVAPGQYVSLCVSDTGTGMAPDVVERAFDPFFTTKPIGMGTGLGLSMIFGFARQSAGEVRIYSEVGQGTMVCLYLPRHIGGAALAETAAELADAPRADPGETVLIVDDEPTIRMLVTEILEDLGYRAVEAADGAAGLEVLRSNIRIDLLVTDVGLPGGMNGRQMADAGRLTRPDMKVLFITGYAENAVLSHGHLDPGMHVMTKPFPMEALASRIKSLIAD